MSLIPFSSCNFITDFFSDARQPIDVLRWPLQTHADYVNRLESITHKSRFRTTTSVEDNGDTVFTVTYSPDVYGNADVEITTAPDGIVLGVKWSGEESSGNYYSQNWFSSSEKFYANSKIDEKNVKVDTPEPGVITITCPKADEDEEPEKIEAEQETAEFPSPKISLNGNVVSGGAVLEEAAEAVDAVKDKIGSKVKEVADKVKKAAEK